MKEELIKELLTTIKDTKNFVLDQAPEVAQEMILLARVESAIFFAVSLFFITIAFTFLKNKHLKCDEYSDESLTYLLMRIVFPIIGFCGVLCAINNLSCWIAPKVFLLKQLSNLLR